MARMILLFYTNATCVAVNKIVFRPHTTNPAAVTVKHILAGQQSALETHIRSKRLLAIDTSLSKILHQIASNAPNSLHIVTVHDMICHFIMTSTTHHPATAARRQQLGRFDVVLASQHSGTVK